ncbi:NAD(P)/FAD-dependent oxidoreductase [Sciscionella marina]|uniref:NAD(P)/FAD-dependent oxidoreductase n=1 Tax=Sciscionella marina TaxID=508770 RepID=UPI000365512F|nr:FAD-dependent oxidoreductase [Sciscionella marina]
MEIVVVGGSAAGATAVRSLRAKGFDGAITLVGDEAEAPYSRVPLSKQVLAGTAVAESTRLPALEDQAVLRTGTAAIRLDQDRQVVVLADGTEAHYDGLVIATGARPRRLGVAGEHGLRTIEDSLRLHAQLTPDTRVVIVGAGVLGMEIASSCLALGIRPTLVDKQPPLRRVFGDWISARLTQAAADAGARILAPVRRLRIDVSRERIRAVIADGCRIRADVLISAIGDVPATEWLAGSGLPASDNGLEVDNRGRVTDRITAAGDVTLSPVGGALRRLPHWTHAIEQAQVAAAALVAGDAAAPYEPLPYYWTEQFGRKTTLCAHTAPIGPPDDHNAEILTWSAGQAVVGALNHKAPVGRLRRLHASLNSEGPHR